MVPVTLPPREKGEEPGPTREETEEIEMLENLIGVTEYGTITEELELICTMTGFRRRFLVHHIGEGFFRSVELEAR